MLNIYLDKYTGNEDVIHDVNEGILMLDIKDNDKNRELIEAIEHGKYNDNLSYIDRYGYKLSIQNMSNGCKAALCLNNSNAIIDLRECGENAISLIVGIMRKGSIIMPLRQRDLSALYGDEIDASIGEYRFSSMKRLNYYLSDEYPFNPDMSIGGIEYV